MLITSVHFKNKNAVKLAARNEQIIYPAHRPHTLKR